MTQRHTTGRWNYRPDENGTIIRNEKCEDVCEVSLPMRRERGYDACAEEQLQNAALIAAAPELLEACKLASRWFEKLVEDKDFQPDEVLANLLDKSHQPIKQAIAKAEGR